MRTPDYYSEEKLKRSLEKQKEKAWDLEKDIPWEMGVDLSKPFVGLDPDAILFPHATREQKIVISQLLGLIVISTFNEFEISLERSKKECFDNLLRNYPVNPELIDLGEQFFEEESKHAKAFQRYMKLFAEEVNISYEELKSILPVVNNSAFEKLFRLNGLAGGQALWWTVAAVEEESILIYRHLKKIEDKVDPLFFHLHRKHFEEESRHASYAFIMLDLFRKRGNTPIAKVHKKLDYLFSEVLQITWVFQQMLKVKNVKKFKGRHPFFERMLEVLPMLKDYSPIEIIHTLFTRAPYISLILNPLSNKHLKKALKANDAYRIPRPDLEEVPLSCDYLSEEEAC